MFSSSYGTIGEAANSKRARVSIRVIGEMPRLLAIIIRLTISYPTLLVVSRRSKRFILDCRLLENPLGIRNTSFFLAVTGLEI